MSPAALPVAAALLALLAVAALGPAPKPVPREAREWLLVIDAAIEAAVGPVTFDDTPLPAAVPAR